MSAPRRGPSVTMSGVMIPTKFPPGWIGDATSATTWLVGIPLCPDLLRYDDLGAADTWRGRIVRAFLWCLRWWPT